MLAGISYRSHHCESERRVCSVFTAVESEQLARPQTSFHLCAFGLGLKLAGAAGALAISLKNKKDYLTPSHHLNAKQQTNIENIIQTSHIL